MKFKYFWTLIILLWCMTINAQVIDSTSHDLRLDFKPEIKYQNYVQNPNMHQIFIEKSLPLFCRIEHRWDKKTPLLFRFRLGSLDYVNTLESK